MAVTKEEIIEALKEMSLLEASELVKMIEDTFGVSAAAPVAVASVAAGGATEEAEEKTEFDVGVIEAATRTAVEWLTGKPLENVEFSELRAH